MSRLRRFAAAAMSAFGLAGAVAPAAAAPAPVDLAALIASWPTRFTVSGVKTEPTYLEAIDIVRDGNTFTIRGGAPAYAERSVESVAVDAAGHISHRICPAAMDCTSTEPPAGFLATAAVLAAERAGRDLGTVTPVVFGNRPVVCIPGERISILDPVLDPCLDEKTGAVLAQRHRLSGAFDGPTLDPATMKIVPGIARLLSASLPMSTELSQ